MTMTALPPAPAGGFYPYGTPPGRKERVTVTCMNHECPARPSWDVCGTRELGTFHVDERLLVCGDCGEEASVDA